MNLMLHCPTRLFSSFQITPFRPSPRFFTARCCLPFPPDKAKYYRELDAAVNAVQKACRLCVDVKKSLLLGDGRILEKNDQTPVTVADFGVQALISLELSRSFPSIPLVAEEDLSFLQSNSQRVEGEDSSSDNFLLESVFNAVVDKASAVDGALTYHNVLEAIDRGGQDAFAFGAKPSTYWVLDPIDGTRGFLKGSEALYVVGLALVVDGEVALGVMGCPNWHEDFHPVKEAISEGSVSKSFVSEQGIVMVAHAGFGTWKKGISKMLCSTNRDCDGWVRCFVDEYSLVHEAKFCIPDSQTWESLPLSTMFRSTTDVGTIKDDKKVLLLPTCCGSLCKYLMVASGKASVFILGAKLRTIIKAWDHAVGMLCVHEAGGQVTDWEGSPLDFTADQLGRFIFPSGGVLVTNGNVHKKILGMISSGASAV